MASWTDATVWIQKEEITEDQLTLMLTCEAPKLRALDLYANCITKEQLARLVHAPWWGQLTELRLGGITEISALAKLSSPVGVGCGMITPQELEALLLMPWMSTLRWLDLMDNYMGAEHAAVLANTAPMPRLYKLDLNYNPWLEPHLDLLLESPMLSEETKRGLRSSRPNIASY